MSKARVQLSLVCLTLSLSATGHSAPVACNDSALGGMHVAIVNYIEQDSNGASKGVTIDSERCLSSYASALVHYHRRDYDDQVAYLRYEKKGWVVLGVATGFDGDFMSTIPEPLQQ